MKLSTFLALTATGISALIIFGLRGFPFFLFSRKDPPAFLRFVEKYIPPMVMAILLIYCLKDIHLRVHPFGIPYITALTCTIVLHLWKHNSMISIFGGTIIFMILNHLL